MRRILLWVCLDTHFREMVRIARLLQVRPGYQPTILFACRYPLLDRDLALCRSEGIAFEGRLLPRDETAGADGDRLHAQIGATSPPIPMPSLKRWGIELLRRIYRALGGRRFVGRILEWDFVLTYGLYRRRLREAREDVERLQPALVILPEDNVEYATAPLIKAAHERGIPSAIVPYTLADALEPAEAYWSNSAHGIGRPLNRLLGAAYPRWKYSHRGRDLLRLPAGHVWAQEYLGLAPPQPWILNSGAADVIAVESDAVRDYYTRAGLEAERLVVTGSLRQDETWARLPGAGEERRRLLSELGLPERRRLFVCALPPNQYPERRPDCEFRRYEDLVRFWFEGLGGLADANVLVNLHPRVPPETMYHLEQGSARIVQTDVARLIALCDCFVASVSATICLAIACGKPVVNYDVYRFRYLDFVGVGGVITMETRAAFVESLRRLTEDDSYYRVVEERQKADQSRWGRLDGLAADRLMRLFERLLPDESAGRATSTAD